MEQQAELPLPQLRATAGADLVVNARLDNFLYAGDVADAIARARAYRRAGADCVYPIMAPLDVLQRLATRSGPLKAHANPTAPRHQP